MLETIHDAMQWIGGGTVMYILPFLAVISILVFVHEWGHYIVARLCGVRVETFSIGFGRKLWSRRDRAGTEWQVALIPLGGYVKMFGDTDPASSTFTESVQEAEGLRAMTPAERNQAFFAKPVWKRAAIVFAGPAVNFLFALILLVGLYTTVGHPVTPPVGAAVIAGSAADEAGFRPGDRVLSIDGETVRRFSDIQRAVAVTLDKPISVTVRRDDRDIVIDNVKPRIDVVTDRFGFKHERGLIGLIAPSYAVAVESIETVNGRAGNIEARLRARMGKIVTLGIKGEGAEVPPQKLMIRLSPDLNADFLNGTGDGARAIQLGTRFESEIVSLGPVDATVEGVREIWFVSAATLQSLGQMIAGTRSAKELGGIIRIGAVAGDAAQSGILSLILLGAMLSINLGLINLLPIPMLDGGHLLFYALEALKGRPISEKVQDAALRLGFFVLIALMVFSNLNDIVQLSK